MPQTYLEAVCRPGQTVNPLFAFLGITVDRIGPDEVRLCLTVKPGLIQGAGRTAGGILATLLDEAMAHVVLAGNLPGQATNTVDMNVSYLRPVAEGASLLCLAQVLKRGSRVIFAEAEVLDLGQAGADSADEGRQAARSTATFILC